MGHRQMKLRSRAVLGPVLWLVGGCAGDASTTNMAASPAAELQPSPSTRGPEPVAPPRAMVDAGMTTGTDAQAPTLDELVREIFQPGCLFGRCHVTAAPAANLSFTGNRVPVYEMLVNVPSTEVPGRFRVVPYDPDASYLMEKITAAEPAVGEPMPPMIRLNDDAVQRIRRWIEAGAPP